MFDREMLFTFAEIAIALAGFSAIIGVLSSRQQSIDLKANALRLQVMLETCFMVAAASVAPILIHRFDDSTDYLWQIASTLFLCIAIPFEFVARSRTKDMPSMTLTRLNVNTVNWALSLGADLLLVAIVLNLVATNAQAFYFLALFFQLTVAGILFVQFAAETFVTPDHE
jgi:hypothetical protein